ncbi:MAG: DUF1127 domain-containing protein [Alcanivorax sp.]|nr:DUF1127 domain-containing protein [Alcanivorax sp.]
MAFVSLPRVSAPTALPVRALYAFENFKKTMRQRAMFRKTITELNSLSDRELHDLGLNRSMITDVARKAVYH